MSSIRKAGVAFYPGREFGPDLTGKADTFAIKYKIAGSADAFTEPGDAFSEMDAGTYTVPLTLPTVGDYLVVIESSEDGVESLAGNVVVAAANIDDVKLAIDNLRTVADSIAADVDGLDGDTLSSIEANLNALKALIDDEDGATVNSVMEWVEKIDAALVDGTSGLSALSGFTDDIENMMVGTEFLADGSTANPFYDENNPGVAKEASLVAALSTLQDNICLLYTSDAADE